MKMKLIAATPEEAVRSLVNNGTHGRYNRLRIDIYAARASDIGFTVLAGPDNEFCVAQVYADGRLLGQTLFPDYTSADIKQLKHKLHQYFEHDVELEYKGKLGDSDGQTEA